MIKLFKFGQLQRHIETTFSAQFNFLRWGDKTSIYQKGINPLGVRNRVQLNISSQSTGSLGIIQIFFLVEPPSFTPLLRHKLVSLNSYYSSQIHGANSVWLQFLYSHAISLQIASIYSFLPLENMLFFKDSIIFCICAPYACLVPVETTWELECKQL